MDKPLSGMKVAILAANGCMESHVLESQRALLAAGASISIVSVGTGLIGAMNDSGWGHNFAVDKAINVALAADYDMLIIPDGSASHDKLKTTAHTKRFISGFMMAHKPVAAFGGAVEMMMHSGQAEGYYVSANESMKMMIEEGGSIWSEDDMIIWGNLMTGMASDMEAFMSMMMMHFMQSMKEEEMAEAA